MASLVACWIFSALAAVALALTAIAILAGGLSRNMAPALAGVAMLFAATAYVAFANWRSLR